MIYYLEVLLVESNGHGFIYLGFTAQVLKVCRTPGPTAYLSVGDVHALVITTGRAAQCLVLGVAQHQLVYTDTKCTYQCIAFPSSLNKKIVEIRHSRMSNAKLSVSNLPQVHLGDFDMVNLFDVYISIQLAILLSTT